MVGQAGPRVPADLLQLHLYLSPTLGTCVPWSQSPWKLSLPPAVSLNSFLGSRSLDGELSCPRHTELHLGAGPFNVVGKVFYKQPHGVCLKRRWDPFLTLVFVIFCFIVNRFCCSDSKC